jgi:hypothetical protein
MRNSPINSFPCRPSCTNSRNKPGAGIPGARRRAPDIDTHLFTPPECADYYQTTPYLLAPLLHD